MTAVVREFDVEHEIVSSPSKYGSSRNSITTFTNNGNERYSVSLSDNIDTKNFFYDTWVYLTSSSSSSANLEFDVNQTMPNGQTVMMGVQCDGWTGHWAYTVNTGSAGSQTKMGEQKRNQLQSTALVDNTRGITCRRVSREIVPVTLRTMRFGWMEFSLR